MKKFFDNVQTLKSSNYCGKFSKSVSQETLVGGTATNGREYKQIRRLFLSSVNKPLSAVGTFSAFFNAEKVVEKLLRHVITRRTSVRRGYLPEQCTHANQESLFASVTWLMRLLRRIQRTLLVMTIPASCREAHKRRFIFNLIRRSLEKFFKKNFRDDSSCFGFAKILALALILTLITTAESLAVQSWDCSPIPGTNTCTATLEGNTLTISGSGAMKDYSSYNSTPWFSIRESISTIVVEGANKSKNTTGITSIGKYSLCGTSLNSLNIAPTVSSIGEYAFGWTRGNNKELDLSGIKTLGEYAFYGSSNILSVDLSNATSIGDNAFSSIPSLGYAKLNQQTLANIPSYAFSGTKIDFCSYNKDPIRCNMCTGGVNIGSPNSNTPVYKEGNCVAVGDCGEGYVQNGNICKKLPGCGTFENGKCTTCTQGYLTNSEGTCTPEADCKNGLHKTTDGACVANDDANCNTQEGNKCTECKGGYLEQSGGCVTSCGAGYKQMENWCNRIRYTPAEAAPLLHNDNTNEVTITFKK